MRPEMHCQMQQIVHQGQIPYREILWLTDFFLIPVKPGMHLLGQHWHKGYMLDMGPSLELMKTGVQLGTRL